MKHELYPDEIAEIFCRYTDCEDSPMLGSASKALYDLSIVCQNTLNASYFRDMYRLLENVAMKLKQERRESTCIVRDSP